MSDNNNNNSCSFCRCDLAWAHLILRLWVGLRLLFAGLDKMREKGGNGFGFSYIEKSMQPIVDNMQQYAFLPGFSIPLYAAMLPWALLIVGAWSIIGVATRFALIAAGLTFVTLSVGLMALPDDVQVVQRGIEVIVAALALMTASANKFSVDGLLRKK